MARLAYNCSRLTSLMLTKAPLLKLISLFFINMLIVYTKEIKEHVSTARLNFEKLHSGYWKMKHVF